MQAAQERLIAFGFRDVEQTRAALEELTAGLTRRSRVMQQLLPAMLGWLSAAPDPDLGLLALRRLTEGYKRSSTLARRFRRIADRGRAHLPVARLVAHARQRALPGACLRRRARRRLERHEPGARRARRPGASSSTEALDSLDWREDDTGRRSGLRRFKRRHLLRIGAARRARLRGARRGRPRAVGPRRRVRRRRAALTRADACRSR